MCVSTVVEGFLVDRGCFIKRFFIIRNLRQSSINRLWDVVDNARRVIRFPVDIERDVIRFVKWHVFTTGQVERDIKKVYNFLVGFDRYFEAVLSEDVAQILLNLLSLSWRCLHYSEAVVSVQAKIVAIFLLNTMQEVGANELTGLCTELHRISLARRGGLDPARFLELPCSFALEIKDGHLWLGVDPAVST